VDRFDVFVTRKIPAAPLKRVTDACHATVWPERLPPSRDVLLESVRGVDGILSLLTDRIDGELLDAAGPQLKVVSNMAVGLDNVDLAAATERGVLVGHTPGVLTDATADLAMALILSGARRLSEGQGFVKAGQWVTWEPELLLGLELRGATLGIVGMGAIGSAVARRAAAFGMEILYVDHDSRPEAESQSGARRVPTLAALLEVADVVSVHVPLTEETHHLIDAAALARMKPAAVLVNTSRGPTVDTAALVDALTAHEIAGAALDVTDPEPMPADHPLLALESCTVVPHLGSATRVTRDRMGNMAADNLLAGLRGEVPPNLANPAALSK